MTENVRGQGLGSLLDSSHVVTWKVVVNSTVAVGVFVVKRKD